MIYGARKWHLWRGAFVAASMLATSAPIQGQVSVSDSRFCVIAVLDGEPTAADGWAVWRMTNTRHRVPGLPSLVFTPTNRKGAWIIDEERRFASFETPFPRSYLDADSWVREPWSGRVIATAHHPHGLYELVDAAAGSKSFRQISGPNGPHYSRPYLLPQSREVLVVRHASDSRTPQDRRVSRKVFVVEKDGPLVPWRHDDVIWQHGINSPSFHWSDELNAVVIIDGSGGATNHKSTIHVLKDGAITEVGTLRSPGYGYRIEDLSNQQAAIVVTAFSAARLVSYRTPAGTEKYRLDHLHEQLGNGAGSHFLSSKQHGKVLYLKKFVTAAPSPRAEQESTSFWNWFPRKPAPALPPKNVLWRIQLVERDALKDLDVELAPMALPSAGSVPFVHMVAVPNSSLTLLASDGALYMFDGTALHLVDASQIKDFDRFLRFAGASTIGRLLMATSTGLYEITAAGVRPLDIPELSGPPFSIRFIKDWEAAGVVVVNRRSELFAIDRDLKVQRVANQHAVADNNDIVGEQPGNGDITLNGKDSVLVMVDTERHGPE